MPVTTDVRVAACRDLGGGVRELTLQALDGDALPPFSAGSHVVVHLPLPAPLFNAYSLACCPDDTSLYRIAVHRVEDGAGGSRYVHEQVGVGDVLTIERPRNLFPLVATARHHLLVAGGIGITPFVAYVHRLVRDGGSFELHHVARDGGCEPLLDELRELAPGAVRAYGDRAGLTTALEDALTGQPLGTHLSVCGPAAMMDAVTTAAHARGWPASRIHEERFSAADGPREAFDAVLAGSERRIAVPADATLLEALEAAGVELPYLCRRGVCGECRTRLLDGEPDHRDLFLTAAEHAAGDQLMPCVSRAASGATLVLDLS